MAHIRVDDKEYELSGGELRVGTGDDADLRLDGPPGVGVVAIITVEASGAAAVRRASSAAVSVNGVPLGAEPSPLLHGDRIEVAGQELRFSDDRKSGSTVSMPALDVPSPSSTPAAIAGGALAGGRLVSLVDGREYVVPASGLRIGRDASCDVVVPDHEVSRRHAEILEHAGVYAVRDLSTNGVLVNGLRAVDAQRLRRGDVLRVGSEEFRFYAEPVQGRTAARAGAAGAVARASRPRAPRQQLAGANGLSPAEVAAPRRLSPLVWIAAAALIGAVVFVIQDR